MSKKRTTKPQPITPGDTVAWCPSPRVPSLMGKVLRVGKETLAVAINGDETDVVTIDKRKARVVGSAEFTTKGTESTEGKR